MSLVVSGITHLGRLTDRNPNSLYNESESRSLIHLLSVHAWLAYSKTIYTIGSFADLYLDIHPSTASFRVTQSPQVSLKTRWYDPNNSFSSNT